MLTPDYLRTKFDAGLPYDAYVQTAQPGHAVSWGEFKDAVQLNSQQRSLLGGFTREMNVLVSSGTWCGDCVQQCPFLTHIESANPTAIRVRFVDRDEHADLAESVKICGGLRVPVAVFMNEDFDLVSLFGDRTLHRYRAIAARQLGASCPLPGAPVAADERDATLQDWIDEFERVQLLLRLSTKLSQRHAD